MHAKITAHRGILVFDLLATESSDEVATSLDRPGNMGQVIMNTAKNLGVSAEALQLLRSLKRGHDSLGDIDWFKTRDGQHAFSWLGAPHALKDPKTAETSRQYHIGGYVAIANEVPEGAKAAIDKNFAKN